MNGLMNFASFYLFDVESTNNQTKPHPYVHGVCLLLWLEMNRPCGHRVTSPHSVNQTCAHGRQSRTRVGLALSLLQISEWRSNWIHCFYNSAWNCYSASSTIEINGEIFRIRFCLVAYSDQIGGGCLNVSLMYKMDGQIKLSCFHLVA